MNNYFNWKQNYNDNYTSWNYKKSNKNIIKYSAGILPYSYDQDGNLFFLLGKDNDGDWSDFGGRCEFRDQNNPKNTASREFYEETLGSILNIKESLEKLNDCKKIESKTLNGSPYYMYFVFVDFNNYTDTFNKTSSFLKYQFDLRINSKILEKIAIRWVCIDTLLNCIDNRDDSRPISLRGVFYKTITLFKEVLMDLQR
jgi:hypothetical protein